MKHLQSYQLFEARKKYYRDPLAIECLRLLFPRILYPDLYEFNENIWYSVIYSKDPITNIKELKSSCEKNVDNYLRVDTSDCPKALLDPIYKLDRSVNNIQYYFSRYWAYIDLLVYYDNPEKPQRFGYYSWTDSGILTQKSLKQMGLNPVEIDMYLYLKNLGVKDGWKPQWRDII